MWDANAPPFVAQLRTDVASCAIWISEVNSAGQEAARLHYPRLNLSGGQGSTADPLPAGLISQKSGGMGDVAEGAGGVITGLVLELDLYLPATTHGGTPRTTGYVESFVITLCRQLKAIQPRILPFNGAMTWEESSDPTPGAWAGDKASHPTAFHHIKIRIPCGYNV